MNLKKFSRSLLHFIIALKANKQKTKKKKKLSGKGGEM
jgi:hypothetical protein